MVTGSLLIRTKKIYGEPASASAYSSPQDREKIPDWIRKPQLKQGFISRLCTVALSVQEPFAETPLFICHH